MRRLWKVIGLACCLSGSAWAVMAAPIAHVQTAVEYRQGHIPDGVRKRMEASLQVIGERVFQGHTTEEVTAHQKEYGSVIADVAGRVIGGYAVVATQIMPGETTQITLEIAPYGDLVDSVETSVDYGNLSQAAKELVAADLQNVQQDADELLVGLPLDSLAWVDTVSGTLLQERLQKQLPEFTIRTEIVADKKTQVKLYLLPQGEVVRSAEITFRKSAIPRLFLQGVTGRVEKSLEDYVGLPVAFVERHRAEVLADLLAKARQDEFVRQYRIDLAGDLQTGTQMNLELQASTDVWRIEGHVNVDMGRAKNATSLHAELGRKITPHDDVFAQTDFFPNEVSWDVYLGWWHAFSPHTALYYRYELGERDHFLGFHRDIGPRWYVRGERNWTAKRNEWAIGYRRRDFLGLEYVIDNDDSWFRIIGYM